MKSKTKKYEISVGYEGPTDCCLILTDGVKKKEFLIESGPWHILDTLLRTPEQTRTNFEYWDEAVLEWIMVVDTSNCER